MLKDLLLTNS